MNRKEAQYFAPILKAYGEGKIIEVIDRVNERKYLEYNEHRELDIDEWDFVYVHYVVGKCLRCDGTCTVLEGNGDRMTRETCHVYKGDRSTPL